MFRIRAIPNFSCILILLSGFSLLPKAYSASTQSYYTFIPESEKKSIVTMLNATRRSTAVPAANMKAIVWDYALEAALVQFRNQLSTPYWFFAEGTDFPDVPGFKHNFNGMHVFDYNPPLPQFTNLKGTYRFLYHDTCKSGPSEVARITKYRVKQKNCFDYNSCNTSAPHYESCGPKINLPPACLVTYMYYPVFVEANIETVACILLGIPGPFTPNHQPNAFWCFGRVSDTGMNTPVGFPYESGVSCSDCPTGYSRCSQGLCVP